MNCISRGLCTSTALPHAPWAAWSKWPQVGTAGSPQHALPAGRLSWGQQDASAGTRSLRVGVSPLVSHCPVLRTWLKQCLCPLSLFPPLPLQLVMFYWQNRAVFVQSWSWPKHPRVMATQIIRNNDMVKNNGEAIRPGDSEMNCFFSRQWKRQKYSPQGNESCLFSLLVAPE